MSEAAFCDFNAGAPATQEVLARFLEVEQAHPANPASAHAPGRAARAVLEEAREQIAAALLLHAQDVVFTSGGTEAANLAVLGLGEPSAAVLCSDLEHPAIAQPAELRGCCRWQIQAPGVVQLAPPSQLVGLLALVHGQSETGALQPVLAACELSQRLGVPCVVDAAQSLGRVDLAPVLDAGGITVLSPHKCGGLRGSGVLAGRNLHALLRPLLRGGSQESGLRPGTQSPALAAANALAIASAIREQPARAAQMFANRAAFLAGLQASGAAHEVVTPLANSLANTLLVHFPAVDGRSLLPLLDLAGVHASHGSACSSGSPTPPRALLALGRGEAWARACVRFSFGWNDARATLQRAAVRAGEKISVLQKKSRAVSR